MKVVQINAVYGFSSTGRTTRELHEYLLNEAIDSYVFCANTIKQEDKVFLIGDEWDHKIHSLKSHLFGLQGYFSKGSTLKMIEKLDTIQPEVVILRNLHSNYVNVPLLLNYLALKNIATIIVLHDVWPFTGLCCHYTEDNCYKWQTHCSHCPIRHKYNDSWLFDRSSKIFDDKLRLFQMNKRLGVVGVSNWVTNEASQSPIFSKAKKITRIYNWIDHNVFLPKETQTLRQKLGLSKNDFIVLGIAQRWSISKGYAEYVELAKNCKEIKIILVGKNDDTSELPLNMLIIPPTNSAEELASFYSMADVFLNFSIQETFGKVTAEALSCGTPVIAYNSTANPELCGEGCGYVIDERTWKATLPYIKEVQKTGKESYTDKCVDFARSQFSKEKNIKQYLDLFNRL